MFQRKEVIGKATLYLGDCREVLPTIAIASAIITDPPYGLNYKPHNTRGRIANDGAVDFRRMVLRLARDFAEVGPTTLAMFTRWDVWRDVHNAFEHLFPPCNCLVWDKSDCGQGNLSHIGNSHELIYVSAPGDFLMRVDDARPQNIIRQKKIPPSRMVHPTEKPTEVMRFLVEALCRKGEIVLDPFMGSGTTGVAALGLDRQFIGIECDEKHFATACRRIEDAQRQGNLLGDAA